MPTPPQPPFQLSRQDAQSVIDWLNLRTWTLENELINVQSKEYGAKGDGSTDDTEAIQRAIKALGPNGGTIFFPYGVYKLSGQLNFDDTRSVRLVGVGALTAGATPATQLQFTQEGAQSAISARSTGGFGMADLGVFYSSGSYTGALLDYTHSAKASDSAYGVVDRCHFAGLSVRSAIGVNLDKAIITTFRDCYFQNLAVGAIGQASAGRYSNVIRFNGCSFSGMETSPLKNAGDSWYVDGCTFDSPLHSGAAAAYSCDAGVIARASVFTGNWMGDVGVSGIASTWINWHGTGLTVTGNLLGGRGGENVLGVNVQAGSSSVHISGNRGDALAKGIQLAEGVNNYIIGANELSSCTGKKVSLDGGATDAGEGFLSN